MLARIPKHSMRQTREKRTYLPELFTGVFSGHSLQDLGTAGMLVHEVCHIVDRAVDYYVLVFGLLVVLGHVGRGEDFGHFEGRGVVSVGS